MSRFVHSKSNLTIWRTAWPLHIQCGWLEASSDYADYWNANLTSDNIVCLVESCFDSPKSSWWATSTFWRNMWLLQLLFDCWQVCQSFELQIWFSEHEFVRLQSCICQIDCWTVDLTVGSPNRLWDIGFGCGEAPSTIRTPPWLSEVHFDYRKASFTFEYCMSLFRFQCDWWQSHSIDTKPMRLLQLESNRWSSNVTLERRILTVDRQTWPLQHPITSWT